MSEAVSKVEIWEPGASSALYTLTNECLSVYFKEILTSGIGNFSVTLPTCKNGSYYYNDIDLFDKVKIWLGSTSGSPHFIGRVTEISGPLSIGEGYTRVISGLSQGEILLRRFKTNKTYDAVAASTIVTEWANDLGLGTGDIETDSTPVSLEVQTKTYFDLLRWISDYWASADVQIKKDFYVNVNYNLVWKSRPFRTSGVPTFIVGDNILGYNVTRKIEEVKNNITVYGFAEKPIPSDKDAWTESLTPSDGNWSAISASTVSFDTGNKVKGSGSIKTYGNGQITDVGCIFTLNSGKEVNANLYPLISFWAYRENIFYGNFQVTLYDTANKSAQHVFHIGPEKWTHLEVGAGKNNVDLWNVEGGFDWTQIKKLRFDCWLTTTSPGSFWIDGLFFGKRRWSNTTSNTTSISTYGQRDMEVTDDKLHSDSECQKRAETLLYQHKDPPTQIVIVAKGDNNILVGDRVTITIPAENITSQPYDIISVAQSLTLNEAFRSTITMVNTPNIREPIEAPSLGTLFKLKRLTRELALTERTYPP